MINKTDWEPFAKQTGSSLDELKTIEGVVKVGSVIMNGQMQKHLISRTMEKLFMAETLWQIILL